MLPLLKIRPHQRQSIPIVWAFHYSLPASGILTLEEPGNRIRSWYPITQDIHDSSQLQEQSGEGDMAANYSCSPD